MPKPKTSTAKRRNRRADVERAAVEVFWRKGYASASIQDVAEEVGMLKGSLYHYIDSKEDLLWEIVEVVHGRSSAILREVAALEDASPVARLHDYVKRHALWYLDNPKEVTVFLREWRQLKGERRQIADDHRHGYDRAIRQMIEDAKPGPAGLGVPSSYAARYVLAALNAMPDWYHPGGGDPPERIAEAYADMTVGLLSATSSADDLAPVRRRRAA